MMTFCNIADLDNFFEIINGCTGGVFFKESEGRYVDIRHNTLVLNLLKVSCGSKGIEKLGVHVECASDRVKLIQYMMDVHMKSTGGNC